MCINITNQIVLNLCLADYIMGEIHILVCFYLAVAYCVDQPCIGQNQDIFLYIGCLISWKSRDENFYHKILQFSTAVGSFHSTTQLYCETDRPQGVERLL